jgi:hypothetical protein
MSNSSPDDSGGRGGDAIAAVFLGNKDSLLSQLGLELKFSLVTFHVAIQDIWIQTFSRALRPFPPLSLFSLTWAIHLKEYVPFVLSWHLLGGREVTQYLYGSFFCQHCYYNWRLKWMNLNVGTEMHFFHKRRIWSKNLKCSGKNFRNVHLC